MRSFFHRRGRAAACLSLAGLVALSPILSVPAAQADPAPTSQNTPVNAEPAQPPLAVIDSADALQRVRAQLAEVGMSVPDVDPSVTRAVDESLFRAVPEQLRSRVSTPSLDAAEASDGNAAIAPEAFPANPGPDGPNYHWTNDLLARVLAGKPLDPVVLQRVAGSFFDAPDIPAASRELEAQGKSLYGPGTPVFVGNSMICTLAVAGYDAQGNKVGITAGHCGKVGDAVMSADSWKIGPSGRVVASNPGQDYAVIQFGENAEVTRSYNGVTVNSVGGAPAPGQTVCKSGVGTGTTCGITWSTQPRVILTQVCAMQGDSGGPVTQGDRLVGTVSGGAYPNYALACRSPLQGPLHMPTVVSRADATMADLNASGGPGAGFQLAG
nr:S1 family peptidase [Corynebacterium uropygiale]